MQGACVSILCVCICVSVLLRSAISQQHAESDTYTVRMDESLSLLLFSSLIPFFFFASSLPFIHIVHHTSQFVLLLFFCVWKCWPQILFSLFSLIFSSSSLIFHSSFPFPTFYSSHSWGNFSFNSMFLQTSLFLSMQLTVIYYFPEW